MQRLDYIYKTIISYAILLLCSIYPTIAQQMTISDFNKVHKPILRPTPGRDKKGALINLSVVEQGFQFKVTGQEIKPTEGEGTLTIVVPKKSPYIEVIHPEYGTLFWKSPKKLKKKRVYNAILQSLNPKSEYKISKQWAVLEIDPKNAIVTVDSLTTKVTNGSLQLYLNIGKHPLSITSPFHKPLSDTITIVDSLVTREKIQLTPIYSYIQVNTPTRNATLTIDGAILPKGEMRSGKLLAGKHTIELSHKRYRPHSVDINLGENDRQSVEMELYHRGKSAKTEKNVNITSTKLIDSTATQKVTPQFAQLSIKAFDNDCEIIINRETIAKGEWNGELPVGEYYLMSRRGAVESRSIYYELDGLNPTQIELPTPMTYYGKLNISSNVPGAKIFINDELVGITPLIVNNLDKEIRYNVELRKEGYKSNSKMVKLVGNALVDLNIKIKNKNK